MTSCWGLLNFLFMTKLASNCDRTQKLMMNDPLKGSVLISESDNLKKQKAEIHLMNVCCERLRHK